MNALVSGILTHSFHSQNQYITMPPKTKSTLVNNSSISASVDAATTALSKAGKDVDKAMKSTSSESLKLLKTIRRLRKRRASLQTKKNRAAAANRKNPTKSREQVISKTTTDLKDTDETIKTTTADRQTVLHELSGLRSTQKQVKAYVRAITAANKKLAQPERTRRRRKTKK